MVLARNNLVGNNLNVTLTIKNTQFNKGRVLDKILVSMIKNCINNLDSAEVDQILSTDSITKFSLPQEKLLTFNPKDLETEPHFDLEENKLLTIIYGVIISNLERRRASRI